MSTARDQLIFEQDPSFSTEKLILLKDGKMRVMQRGLGRAPERVIDLRAPDLVYERIPRRFVRLIVVPFIFFVGSIYSTYALIRQRTLPQELSIVTGLLSLVFAVYVINGFEPIEIFRIRDKSMKILLEIYRPRKLRFRYDDFLAAIGKATNDEPKPKPKEPKPKGSC